MVETFLDTLNTELIYRRSWRQQNKLGMVVLAYLKCFYTPWNHSRPGYLSPIHYEQLLVTQIGVRFTEATSPRVLIANISRISDVPDRLRYGPSIAIHASYVV